VQHVFGQGQSQVTTATSMTGGTSDRQRQRPKVHGSPKQARVETRMTWRRRTKQMRLSTSRCQARACPVYQGCQESRRLLPFPAFPMAQAQAVPSLSTSTTFRARVDYPQCHLPTRHSFHKACRRYCPEHLLCLRAWISRRSRRYSVANYPSHHPCSLLMARKACHPWAASPTVLRHRIFSRQASHHLLAFQCQACLPCQDSVRHHKTAVQMVCADVVLCLVSKTRSGKR